MAKKRIEEKRALGHLMDCLAVEGLSGRERRIAEVVRKKLLAAGCKASWLRFDRAHEKIAGDFETGNLILKLPGTSRGPRRLLMGHLDTVPLCRGAIPVRRGRRIVSKARTGLGGDNRTAVACILTVVESILRHALPYPPLTALFTFGEEVGLLGARYVKTADLGHPKLGFNIDSGDPRRVVTGAISAERFEIDVQGISSHAGVHPEHGVSAALIVSRALTEVAARGYFGKISRGRQRGTSNIGIVRGGEATNQVMDHVYVRGESRSHDNRFLEEITAAYRKAFERAARSVKNHKRKTGKIKFRAAKEYKAFKLENSAPVIRFTKGALKALGKKPQLVVVDGGLDANYLNAKGVPTVTLGAGQHSPHTVDEYIEVAEYLDGCRLALEVATRDAQ